MSAKVTPWFPGDVAPERVGVYRRHLAGVHTGVVYSYWNGTRWSTFCKTAKRADVHRAESAYQCEPRFEWCGLTTKGGVA